MSVFVCFFRSLLGAATERKSVLLFDPSSRKLVSNGLYYKNKTIINAATIWSITLELSIMIIEPSIMLQGNACCTGITHDDHY